MQWWVLINKLNENNIRIAESRFNLIKREKEKFSSVQKYSKKIKTNGNINKKDIIYDDLTKLFGRIKEIRDDSNSTSFIPVSILHSRKNFFFDNSSRDINKNKVNNNFK